MSRVLDLIVELQVTKIKLEQLVQDKHFMHAVRTLVKAEKSINSADLKGVEALSGLRDHFADVKDQLQDTLMNELQNHIYLKSNSALMRIGKEM